MGLKILIPKAVYLLVLSIYLHKLLLVVDIKMEDFFFLSIFIYEGNMIKDFIKFSLLLYQHKTGENVISGLVRVFCFLVALIVLINKN